MSRTDKDHPKAREEHWQSVYTPSWFNRAQRQRRRLGGDEMVGCLGIEPFRLVRIAEVLLRALRVRR
jgi:hypothetical protein